MFLIIYSQKAKKQHTPLDLTAKLEPAEIRHLDLILWFTFLAIKAEKWHFFLAKRPRSNT